MTEKLKDSIPLEEIFTASKEIASQVEDYRHCDYQAAVAGIIASQEGDLIVAVSPTGSGKTWIQGVVAKHFCRMGKKVVVIEPNEMLAK